MQFICDGDAFDSVDMIDVPPQGTNYLGIYVTADYRCVFVGMMTYEGFKVTRATARQVEEMARTVGHEAVIKASTMTREAGSGV